MKKPNKMCVQNHETHPPKIYIKEQFLDKPSEIMKLIMKLNDAGYWLINSKAKKRKIIFGRKV